MDLMTGRGWRALQDTVNDPIVQARRPLGWSTWQRSEDYYVEGMLVWLDIDTRIRELSGDKRSLNDVARAFFGAADGSLGPAHYRVEDVVKALSSVQPPDVERQRSSEVLDALDEATGLVTDARIAVVAGDSEQYAGLVTDLRRTAEDLQHLESTLEHPPS